MEEEIAAKIMNGTATDEEVHAFHYHQGPQIPVADVRKVLNKLRIKHLQSGKLSREETEFHANGLLQDSPTEGEVE